MRGHISSIFKRFSQIILVRTPVWTCEAYEFARTHCTPDSRLEAEELEQLQGDFWKASVCCIGCSHLHLLQTVPRPKKKFLIKKFIGDRYWKPPAVSARASYSRGRSCMAVILESLFVKTWLYVLSSCSSLNLSFEQFCSVNQERRPTGYTIFLLCTISPTCLGVNGHR